jgi:glycosyltransferase involved in cell wall biosynthesis
MDYLEFMNTENNLLIISDTKIQKIGDRYFGFNSVVLELEVFSKLFDNITWLAFDYSDLNRDESLLEIPVKIEIILLPRSGGKSIISKFKILYLLSYYFIKILQYININNFIHVRGPSGPMFVSLVISYFSKNKQWLFKYANNWNDANPPFFWAIQKKWMIKQKWITGTVNGQWSDMPKHLLSFENPCIDDCEFNHRLLDKFEKETKTLLFVGRIEFEKGIRTFLESLERVNLIDIDKIIIVGVGKNLDYLNTFLLNNKLNVKLDYLGTQSKEAVLNLMRTSHFLILPTTASEGFPKVIAEAWSVCCIPISSNISSIGQYVRNYENGYIWEYRKNIDFAFILNDVLKFDSQLLKVLSKNGFAESQKFTYFNYENKLVNLLNYL